MYSPMGIKARTLLTQTLSWRQLPCRHRLVDHHSNSQPPCRHLSENRHSNRQHPCWHLPASSPSTDTLPASTLLQTTIPTEQPRRRYLYEDNHSNKQPHWRRPRQETTSLQTPSLKTWRRPRQQTTSLQTPSYRHPPQDHHSNTLCTGSYRSARLNTQTFASQRNSMKIKLNNDS